MAAFVLAKGDRIVAQREWELTGEGILVTCNCEKGWECPAAMTRLKPESAAQIDSQLETEIAKLRAEYHIPAHRSAIVIVQGSNLTRLPRLRLRGQWKDEAFLGAARAAFDADETEEPGGEPGINFPQWVLTFTPEESERHIPDIERFVNIAHGWLWYEGALKADELIALTTSVFQPGAWYSPERARDVFKADPLFRIVRGNVVTIENVNHPLKVLKEKAERRLPPRGFAAEELAAAVAGPLPLSAREAEIERELNRHTGEQKIYLRSLQRAIRNADSAGDLLSVIIDLCRPGDLNEANHFSGLITELWNNTFRYELRGRTPNEVRGNKPNRLFATQ